MSEWPHRACTAATPFFKESTSFQSLFGSVADRCKLHVAITLCHISTGAVPNLLWNLKLAFDHLWTSSEPASTRRALKKRLNPTGPRGFYPPVILLILFDHIVPGTDNGGFGLRFRPLRIPPSGLRRGSRVDLRRQFKNL
jgi:hypothetical protein